MDNQHRKIKGYRELSQEEIDLMNRIKAKGAEMLALQVEVVLHLNGQRDKLMDNPLGSRDEFNAFMAAEPRRWASIGKTDIQTGVMALVRAVAQPEDA